MTHFNRNIHCVNQWINASVPNGHSPVYAAGLSRYNSVTLAVIAADKAYPSVPQINE